MSILEPDLYMGVILPTLSLSGEMILWKDSEAFFYLILSNLLGFY